MVNYMSGLPGGNRNNNGTFNNIGNNGNWWSSTENSSSLAWYRNLEYLDAYVYRLYDYYKTYDFLGRCLKD
jgi:hypothetical protein